MTPKRRIRMVFKAIGGTVVVLVGANTLFTLRN